MDEASCSNQDDEAIEIMRETVRNAIESKRRRHRDEKADSHRSLSSMCLKPEQIEEIIKKLKSKSITDQELRTLKNSMIYDTDTIGMVLKEHGALQGLVREIAGHNAEKQDQAIGCICNLAMGNSKARLTVAKHAGPYVILMLDNHNSELKKMASWTLSNLGSCPKACERLVMQGAITKLADVVTFAHDLEVKEAAIQALVNITRQLKSSLREEHLLKIQAAVIETNFAPETLELMFILSCHENFNIQTIPVYVVQHYFNYLSISLETHSATGNTKVLKYLLRFFANCTHIEVYEKLLTYFQEHKDVVKKILDSDMNETMLWLLGNMWKQCPNRIIELLE